MPTFTVPIVGNFLPDYTAQSFVHSWNHGNYTCATHTNCQQGGDSGGVSADLTAMAAATGYSRFVLWVRILAGWVEDWAPAMCENDGTCAMSTGFFPSLTCGPLGHGPDSGAISADFPCVLIDGGPILGAVQSDGGVLTDLPYSAPFSDPLNFGVVNAMGPGQTAWGNWEVSDPIATAIEGGVLLAKRAPVSDSDLIFTPADVGHLSLDLSGISNSGGVAIGVSMYPLPGPVGAPPPPPPPAPNVPPIGPKGAIQLGRITGGSVRLHQPDPTRLHR